MIEIKPFLRDQRGIASILSVIFFIVITSIITVGFMRMALLEGRQSLEDSLSKAALAAAYSGVNDAKRALLYCSQFATVQPECANLSNPNCPGFFESPLLKTKLGLLDDTATGSIQVGDPDLNERYTCTIITEDTRTVTGSLFPGSTDEGTTIIPIKATGAFDTIVITWQIKVPSSTIAGLTYGGDINNASYADSDAIATAFKANEDWPAVMGAHLMVQQAGQSIAYSNPDGTTVAGIEQRQWLFYPYGAGLTDVDASTTGIGPLSRQLARCQDAAMAGYQPAPSEGRYMCQIKIRNVDIASLQGTRYLQLTSMYRDTQYVVSLTRGGAETPVLFDNVNPQIDSTGAVDNVFRRVKVGLTYEGKGVGGRNPILPNAIDTGEGLCKNFAIGAASFIEDCGY